MTHQTYTSNVLEEEGWRKKNDEITFSCIFLYLAGFHEIAYPRLKKRTRSFFVVVYKEFCAEVRKAEKEDGKRK